MIFKYFDMQENCSANCTFRLHSARRYVKPKMCDSEAALGRKKGKEGPSPEPAAQTDRERGGVTSCHFNLSGRKDPPTFAAAPSPAPKSWKKGGKTTLP